MKKNKIAIYLSSLLVVMTLIAGIVSKSDEIINNSFKIYNQFCFINSFCDVPLVDVDFALSKPDEDLEEYLDESIKEEKEKVTYIYPNQDIFRRENKIKIQDIHFGPSFNYDEIFSEGWKSSYPVVDIIISAKDAKVPLNLSELNFKIDPEGSGLDQTPYLEVISEEEKSPKLTIVNQGWGKIKEAKLEYELVGTLGHKKEVENYLSSINLQKAKYENTVLLNKLVDGHNVAYVNFENQVFKKLGKSTKELSEELFNTLNNMSFKEGDEQQSAKLDNTSLFLGVIGRITAVGESKIGKKLTYESYFKSIATVATEGGFGDFGQMELNSQKIINLKSDLSNLEYSVPIAFRLGGNNDVYRIRLILASDKTATYNMQFSISGQGKVLYRSNKIKAFIFVPKAGSDFTQSAILFDPKVNSLLKTENKK